MTFQTPPRDPAFCIIAPTAYLTSTSAHSNRHLVLAHLVETDVAYADFYLSMADRGDYLIMDNGAYELGESYAPDKLIDLAKRCGAHAIVLPDYPAQPADKTIDAAKEWIPLFKAAGFHTFFCPQSEVGDTDDWEKAYVWAAENPDIDIIGMSILAIPNALPHIPKSYARVVMAQSLMERGMYAFEKYHHYLGLNAGPALEIPPLLAMSALQSCDSSGPVWAGLMGHSYTPDADSYQSVRKLTSHVQFDYPYVNDEMTHERIQHNLAMTLGLFDNE